MIECFGILFFIFSGMSYPSRLPSNDCFLVPHFYPMSSPFFWATWMLGSAFGTFAQNACTSVIDEACLLLPGQCSSSADLCNYGRCRQENNTHYRCYCLSGFTGVNCQIPVNECDFHLCQNNASCVNYFPKSGFFCNCPPTFNGTLLLWTLTDITMEIIDETEAP